MKIIDHPKRLPSGFLDIHYTQSVLGSVKKISEFRSEIFMHVCHTVEKIAVLHGHGFSRDIIRRFQDKFQIIGLR